MKQILRNKAIILRKQGLSYSEILKRIPVAKSTLSDWLHSVGLSKHQMQRITNKKLAAIRRGGETKKRQRIERIKKIKSKAISEIGLIDKNNLWLMGIMLYWAEGAKEKEYAPGQGVVFSNSDPMMIKIFLKWLKECLRVPEKRISLEIYIHETHKNKVIGTQEYWSSATGFSLSKFGKIYYKKDKPSGSRKNRGEDYHGLLRIRVRESADINRRIAGWIEGICIRCGMV